MGVSVPALRSTDYVNTISAAREPWFPGDEEVERRIRRIIRWNAAIMVTRANRPDIRVGGHIATYQSAGSLYEVGLNHFFRGKDHPDGGDQVFIQGNASPGVYARAFLEGRFSADRLDGFRQELSRPATLSSYPHPRLMPDLWEFPTVSMGWGRSTPCTRRGLTATSTHAASRTLPTSGYGRSSATGRWSSPSRLARSVSPREEPDNLTFVISCNLQRLNGPVRGNAPTRWHRE